MVHQSVLLDYSFSFVLEDLMEMLDGNVEDVDLILQPHYIDELILYDLRRVVYIDLLDLGLATRRVLEWALSTFDHGLFWFV